MDEQELEARMREALRPVSPPEGMAERILARVSRPQPRVRPWVQWGAMAAALAIGVMGVAGWREQKKAREVEARQVLAQFQAALQVTARKVTGVQKKLVIEIPLHQNGGGD